MGIFDNFIFKNGKVVDNSWVKWFHWNVPDKEGFERNALRDNLQELGHCKECTVLSGCYFVKSKMPKKKSEGFGLLHPHCDCKANFIQKPNGKITAICPIEKFTNYIFSQKYNDNGKFELFKKHLCFTKKDAQYLKREYELQATKKYLNGDYEIGKLDAFGQRINIEIIVSSLKKQNIKIITGWMIYPLGKIVCTAPLGA